MKLDKKTFVYLATNAVESYENEVAFRQGCLAHSLHKNLRLSWLSPYKKSSYTDVLEWVERMELPFLMRFWHPSLFRKASQAVYAASLLEDHSQYVLMKRFLAGSKKDDYIVPNGFYNWLITRQ